MVGMIQALSALATRHQPLALKGTHPAKSAVRFGQDERGDAFTINQHGEPVHGEPTNTKAIAAPDITGTVDTPKLTPLQMATQLTMQLTVIGDYLSDRLGRLTGANGKDDVTSTDPFRLVVPEHGLTEVHMTNGIDVNDMVTISRVQDELTRLEATFPTLEAMGRLGKSTDRIRVAMRQLKADEIFEKQREVMIQGNGVPGKQLSPNTPYPPGMTPLSHAVEPVNTLYDTVLGLIDKESQGDMSHLFGRGGGGGLGQTAMAPSLLMPGFRRFSPAG